MDIPIIEGVNSEIILGTVLGDAYIYKSKKGKTHKISWQHSLKQEEYALWKANTSGINFSIHKRDKYDSRTKKTYSSITVYSVSKMNFKCFYDLVYIEGKKVLSHEVLDMLTPTSLAVWFCDDGNLYYNGKSCQLTLSTDSFENSEEIIKYFKTKWGLKFKTNGKRIRITGVTEVGKFENIFRKYYPSMMDYKILSFVKKRYDDTLTDDRRKFREKKYG